MLDAIRKFFIKRHVKSQINAFDNKEKVYYLQAGFQIIQDGVFCFYINTDEDASIDGQWTSMRETHAKPFWRMFKNEEEHAQRLGETIKKAMFECREEGVFKKLNLDENCCFCVEEFDGLYGWPHFNENGKENKGLTSSYTGLRKQSRFLQRNITWSDHEKC